MKLVLDDEVIERFEIIHFLGSKPGKRNLVFTVKDRNQPGKPLRVLKCLHSEHLNNEEYRRNLVTEGQIVCKMNHPVVVKGYEYGLIGNTPYILMGYINGEHAPLKRRCNAYFVLHLISAVVDALVYFQSAFKTTESEATLVHGDLGLHNLLITKNRKIKIIDFEKSQLLINSDRKTIMNPENASSLFGWTVFSAPERLKRKDHLFDIYSAGAIIYVLLTGKSLLDPRTRTSPDLLPTSPMRMNVKIPRNLDELPTESRVGILLLKIAEKATSHNRDSRYQDPRLMNLELSNIQVSCNQSIIKEGIRAKFAENVTFDEYISLLT